MIEMSPRELPATRAQICELYDDGFRYDIPGAQGLAGAWLSAAGLYYVTAPVCLLADQAAKTLPAIDVAPSDLDAPHCLIWFEHPAAPFGPSAYHLVQATAATGGLYVNLFLDRSAYMDLLDESDRDIVNGGEGLAQGVGDAEWLMPTRQQMDDAPWSPFYATLGCFVAWGEEIEPYDSAVPRRTHLAAHVIATMLLMRQPLAGTSTAHAPRSTQRRLTRSGREPGEVRVITLRSPRGESSGDVGTQRDYAHQWIVRGHWRQQPYGPGRERRRPVWIAPHVKGPEGAPLLGGEKVHLLKR